MTRLAILVNPTNAGARSFVANMTEAARSVNLDVTIVEVSRPQDFLQAYASIRKARADWLHVLDEPMISSRRAEWVEFAAAARLPLISDRRRDGKSGRADLVFSRDRRALLFGCRLRRQDCQGAKPADLPVEQPTRYELIVNLRTAKALGLTMPQSVLLRAEEVIQ